MSLYVLGKVISDSDILVRIAACVGGTGGSFRASVDDDDREVLDDLLPGIGKTFSVADAEGGIDATRLWSEVTMSAVRWSRGQQESVCDQINPPDDYLEAIAHTSLARLARCLTSLHGYESFGLAFVDGGISTVLKASPREVYRTMAWEWRLPWDMSSNRLYVWSPE
jgi:hypothetical protein